MVIGSMIGAGIFSFLRTFGAATGPFRAIIAGGGMDVLARLSQSLAERKPDLDPDACAYARAGFGDYPGFLSACGYLVNSCVRNVAYWALIKSTLGTFFPIFGEGDTRPSILRGKPPLFSVSIAGPRAGEASWGNK